MRERKGWEREGEREIEGGREEREEEREREKERDLQKSPVLPMSICKLGLVHAYCREIQVKDRKSVV